MNYVFYARVSTNRQSNGLEAQQNIANAFINSYGGTIIDTFIDKQSGAKNDRSGLKQALAMCKKQGATLLVAKLDRVSRRVSFIATLMESNIPLKVAELPNADPFQLHIFAALAEVERKQISTRVKQALAVVKSKGVKLGSPLNEERAKQAHQFALTIVPYLEGFKQSGITSWNAMANKLNEMGITTQTGGKWYMASLKKVASYV